MKYLVILVVVLVVFWYWRRAAREETAVKRQPEPNRVPQQEMVQCPICHVHLPRADALPGPGGQLYCCAEHRGRADG
jgi:uncharacterized protein